ncbi:YbaN family protein [Candidatus Altiarchaeota archaeon]
MQSKINNFVRVILIIAGTIFVFLGLMGIFLPILPTTPFLLLAAACYVRSSERLYTWLLTNRLFGEYIRNYREGKGIPLKTKVFSITLLWTTILYSAIFIIQQIMIQMLLILIAIGVSLHILYLPVNNS